MIQGHNNSTNKLPRVFGPGIRAIVPMLALIAAFGCYRATGYDRAALTAQEIPAVGGDRVMGLKSMAGAGDYYVGNDFVALAVDGTPLSERAGIAGAPGGGSIVDVGFISLDTSYRRVSMPCDMLDRMTTVVNQDPDLSLVFYDFKAVNDIGVSRLVMRGQIHDPKRKLAGSNWNHQNFVQDVSAVTTISLGSLDRKFTIETTVTNNRSTAIDIRNIGDFVYQRGGGFRILVAANEDKSGAPLSSWGVDIPGTDFNNPLATSVNAGPVAFMGTEPGSNTLDCHVTLGLLPLDSEQFLIASDPQDSLNETRPIFPERFVAGSLDTGVPLSPGSSLTHKRSLHVKGGISGAADYSLIIFTQNTPNQGTGILNDMFIEMARQKEIKLGTLVFSVEGTALRSGPIPSELRFERYTSNGDPTKDENPDHWRLERVEWMEPVETSEYISDFLFTPLSSFSVLLPEGDYRIISRNRFQSTALQAGTNASNADRPSLATPITLAEGEVFSLGERLSPERSDVYSPYGSRISYAQSSFTLITRGNDYNDAGFIQPMRFTLSSRDGQPDPHLRRFRTISSIFDPTAKIPRPTVSMPGTFHFVGGNSGFGVQLSGGITLWTVPGIYQAYGARGPLSTLESFLIDSRPGLGLSSRTLTVFQTPLPKGWKSFDTPGPSMATSGGMLPGEQLSSALAEGVNVIARTEIDHQADGNALYDDFKLDVDYLELFEIEEYKTAIGDDPLIVNARSSNLDAHGTVTAYFTPADSTARNGGARPSKGWTLADFMTQADGKYNVIIRPRGPQGIFTQLGFDPTLPINLAAPWWHQTGPLSLGKTNGQFDALEILNAGTIAESGINAWWSEYKAVRADWFALLNQQTHDSFTKAVGFSSGRYSQDTPVGLIRTYLNIFDAELSQKELDPILAALKSGAAVVSSGPLLDVSVGNTGPGGLASINTSPSAVTLNLTMLATDWMPVDELRVIVNGQVVRTIFDPKTVLTHSADDYRYFTGTITVPVPAGKDAWLVVEAGVPLDTVGAYRPGSPWHSCMKGIYPIAITNPIFLNLTGGGYTPPGL